MAGEFYLSNELFNIRENFKNDIKIDESKIRPFILSSWKRCKKNKSKQIAEQPVSAEFLEQALKRNAILLESAVPIMEKLLPSIQASHSVIGLADDTGLILHVVGEKQDIEALSVFRKGYIASEETSGTNGIGTGLIEKKPLEILGAEHYYGTATNWCCSSAPIYNDTDFVGVLNISINVLKHHHHSLGLVESAAYAISEQLRLLLLVQEQKVILELLDEGVIILNSEDTLRAINNKAKQMLEVNKSATDFEIGTPFFDFVLESKELLSMLRATYKINDREMTLSLKHGTYQFAVSSSPIKEGGTVLTLRSIKRMREYATRIMSSNAAYSFENIIGESTAIREVIRIAKLASQSDITTLILGESGTGKELFAQAIHNASSQCNGPFVVINCGAIPRTLLESELFGYEDGAFTGAKKQGKPGKFELADGGTVFLDEIGELPLDAQVSLLRLLQEGEIIRVGGTTAKHVNIRILAATNRNLEEAVQQKTFRHDLFYRLNVLSFTIPPLRERKIDIRLLSTFFLDKFAQALGKEYVQFSEETLEILSLYSWPGNVRELENVIERTINISHAPIIQPSDLPVHILQNKSVAGNAPLAFINENQNVLKNKEMETIMEMLRSTQGNMRLAAQELGISRCVLYRKLNKYGLSPNMWRNKD